MIKPNEFQILMLALSFSPLLVWAYKGVDLPGKKWVAAGFAAMLASYVFTVAEGFFAEGFFNAVEHVMYAAAGVCFAVASTALLRLRAAHETRPDK